MKPPANMEEAWDRIRILEKIIDSLTRELKTAQAPKTTQNKVARRNRKGVTNGSLVG